MNAIKCELCGSNNIIKKDGFYFCEFCGTKYSIEEAKNLVVSGTVEITKGNSEKERLLKQAETFIKLQKFQQAKTIYQKITDEFPDDYKGWYGLFSITINDVNKNLIFFNEIKTILEYGHTITLLTNDEEIISTVSNRVAQLKPSINQVLLVELYKANLLSFFPNIFEKEIGLLDDGMKKVRAFNNLSKVQRIMILSWIDKDYNKKVWQKHWSKKDVYKLTIQNGNDPYCSYVFDKLYSFSVCGGYQDIPDNYIHIIDNLDSLKMESAHKATQYCPLCGSKLGLTKRCPNCK